MAKNVIYIYNLRMLEDLTQFKNGLAEVIDASRDLFDNHALERFARGILLQLTTLLEIRDGTFLARIDQNEDSFCHIDSMILVATGHFENRTADQALELLRSADPGNISPILDASGELFRDDYFIGVYRSKLKARYLLFLKGISKPDEHCRTLVQEFGNNISVACDNQAMFVELNAGQREILQQVGESIGDTDRQPGNRSKRIALICQLLAEASGLDVHKTKLISRAAPLHDVGKINVPSEILDKPGKFDPDEWRLMQAHTKSGFDLLISSEMEVLEIAATVARTHHENWDGTGYPAGLKGEEIPLFGRIVAFADVFDSLVSERCYRDPWPVDEAFEYLYAQSGGKFDPALIGLVPGIKSKLLDIQSRYPD